MAILWLLPWMLTAPLFHFHILDMQETRFLPQAFLVHTVFTPDLPGEYSRRPAIHEPEMPAHQCTLARHYAQYSEVDFCLSGEDDNDLKRKIESLPINNNDEFSWLITFLLKSIHGVIPELASSAILLLTYSIISRAPPCIF